MLLQSNKAPSAILPSMSSGYNYIQTENKITQKQKGKKDVYNIGNTLSELQTVKADAWRQSTDNRI